MKSILLATSLVVGAGIGIGSGVSVAAQDPATGAEAKTEGGAAKLYLPASPRAAAYVLGRLSNKELIQAPRVEPVFVAFLERAGLDAKYREEALTGLAGLHKTDRVTELLTVLEKLDSQGTNAAPVIGDLANLLAKSKPAELSAKKSAFEALAAKAESFLVRRVVAVGRIVGEGKVDAVWETAAKSDSQLADLVGALPWVLDPSLRANFQMRVAPLAVKAATPELQQAAILALPFMKGFEAENFSTLAGLVRAGTERSTAVKALAQLPRSAWQKELAGPAVQALVESAVQVPADQRTEPEFLEAVQLGNDLSLLLPADEGKRWRKALGELGVRVLALKTVHEQMLYDKTRLVVEAGKPVEIVFENPDSMPHNFVLIAPGAREEVGKIADSLKPEPDDQGRMFIPKSPKVLFASKLAEPGTRLKLNFNAPAEPGEYTYVCTFPGHWMRMFGTLVVTADVEEYLAKNPEQAAPKSTEWKLADFAGDWAGLDAHRNFSGGKGLFSSLGCVQCHQLGAEGAAFGPNLTGVLTRWKGDKGAVLEQILEPSKVIDEKYRSQSFDIGEENNTVGIVLSEDAEQVTVQSGPSAALIQKLKKSSIKSRSPQEGSAMPGGLLNLLNKEQVLDLLAYVIAEGNAEHPAFKHH